MIESAHVLVTGGAGFIGSALVWALNQRGHDRIFVADVLNGTDKWRNLAPLRFDDYLEADTLLGALDRGVLDQVGTILHLGACSSTTETDGAYLVRNNTQFTTTLAEHAVGRHLRFVYASSAATYGALEGELSDRGDIAELRPLNMYAYSKQLFDLHAKRRGYFDRIAGLKYFNVFGPNEAHKADMRSVANKAFHEIRATGRVRLFKSHRPEFADGEQRRDFLYVKDAVEMTLHLAGRPDANGLFNIGAGCSHTWRELVTPVFEALGRPVDIEFVALGSRRADDVWKPKVYHTAMAPFTIGIIQDHADADRQSNLTRAERQIRDAAGRGAEIICLKELFNAPYFCKAQSSDRFDLAEPLPGPTTDRLQKVAKELAVVLIVPIFERQAAGVYRNSAAVIDADGSLLGVYRKMHIPDDPLFNEKYYFTPGDGPVAGAEGKPGAPQTEQGFKVWKTRYATIGVLICWDQWYPEAARITSLLGAQALFYPTAIGWHPSEKGEWGEAQVDAWRTAQRAHAIANGVYVASPNHVGHEDEPGTDGITFFGRSFIADPFGRYLAEAGDGEEILIARCDPALIETVRRNWPFLRDRRVDAYGPILNRYLGQ